MFFSVLVPVYNVSPYLRACLDSLLLQDFTDFEAVLADDGSTDGSGEICEEYAAKDRRFRVVHLQNGGVEKARRAAFENSSGTYVVFLDSDDYVRPGLLSDLHKIIDREACDIVAFGYQAFDENGVQVKNRDKVKPGLYTGKRLERIRKALIYDKWQRSFNYGSVVYSLCTKAFRAELIRNFIGQPSGAVKGEDMLMTALAVSKAESICFREEYGYFYRLTQNSAMRTFKENDVENIRLVYRVVCEKMPQLQKNVSVWVLYMCLAYAAQAVKAFPDAETSAACLERNMDSGLRDILKKAHLFLPRPEDIKPVRLLKKGQYEKLCALLREKAERVEKT